MLWLERALFAIGVTLAVWCAIVLVEARYYSTMPIPPPTHAETPATLPGDSSAGRASPHPAVAAGGWVARLDAPSVQLIGDGARRTDDTTLNRGAGHIEDTAFPGEPGTSASPAIATRRSARCAICASAIPWS